MAAAGGESIAFLHEFRAPPYGGGNQFLLALRAECERRGVRVGSRISASTRVVLFNSHHGDPSALREARRRGIRVVHRVDGPIRGYRGRDDGTDLRIQAINAEVADATVFQSEFSREAHRELGLTFHAPTVIPNAADPILFHPGPARPHRRPLRVIATSWSDNPRKGGAVYGWLDRHLDPATIQFTFVGRLSASLSCSVVKPPMASGELADELRQHDVYLTASEDDPCSNALIEGLTCGLPAIFRRSGGHPELVRGAGIAFDQPEELPMALARMAEEYEAFRLQLAPPRLADVTTAYLRVMGVGAG